MTLICEPAEAAAVLKCRHGHPLTEAKTYVHPKTGNRYCRTCFSNNRKKAYVREKELSKRAIEGLERL